MKVLVTGGAGYIGSHTVVELASRGHEPIILDNFLNSKPAVLPRLESISGRAIRLYQVDLLDRPALMTAMTEAVGDTPPDQVAVIHFAGLKAVLESVREPLLYYHNNITGSLNLLSCMRQLALTKLVFSSSATVYSQHAAMPVDENSPTGPINPYGQTKAMIETILQDECASNGDWSMAILRYFNPAGAHPSGLIGEDPLGIPNNLMPLVTRVAVGRQEALTVFGDDWPTADGTCIRDYIHVVDLAQGHVAALQWLQEARGWRAFNLGTGKGSSVLELILGFEASTNTRVHRQTGPRRDGDVAAIYANPTRAATEFDWHANASLNDICRDAWNWQSHNPDGYT